MTIMSPPWHITADEVNCLIHSYFQDSGFQHSAFSLRKEGNLDQSPNFTKHIPRGELVDLLCKALLYVEVETHWQGDSMIKNCKSAFSLLDGHVCSPEWHQTIPKSNESKPDPVVKRKANSPNVDDCRSEKRARPEPEVQDAEGTQELSKAKPTESKKPPPKPDASAVATLGEASKKVKKRLTGIAEDVSDPDAIRLLKGHTAEVFVCAWNPVRHDTLATGSKDGVVSIWDIPQASGPSSSTTEPKICYKFLFSESEQGDITALDWNKDGTLLAVGSYDSVLRICTQIGGLYFSNPQHQGPIFSVRFSKSGRWLLTASLDGTVCIWDVKAKKLHHEYRCHTDCCLDIDWLDNSTFASCGADKQIFIMKLNESKPIKILLGHEDEINQIKCNPSRTRLVSCSDDQTARVWNIVNVVNHMTPDSVSSDPVVVLKGHKHAVSGILWCPAGQHSNELVASSSFDGTARLWDSVTGDCMKIFADHKRPVYALSFSPDGTWIATGSGDGWLYIYTVADKEKRWSWYAGADKPGVFEIDWQITDSNNRMALALECHEVGIVDVAKMPNLRGPS